MAKDILIRMRVEIPSQPIVPVSAMIFSHWLPLKVDDFLNIRDGNLIIKIWFDVTCTYWASHPTEDEIIKWANVTAHEINIDVTVENVEDDLIQLIISDKRPPYEDTTLAEKYKKLGEEILERTIWYLNKLITYCKYEKGQYWLEEFDYDKNRAYSMYIHFNAKVALVLDLSIWFRWYSSNSDTVSITMADEATYISRDDWLQVTKFVTSAKKPDLVMQLLSNAENLTATGHRRSAIIEAVTALEIAVNSFSKAPSLDSILDRDIVERVDGKSFANQVDHLGFSTTVKYLLPIVFKEEVLPKELLKHCQEAITIRGSVVHHGQRDVAEIIVTPLIRAIKKTCIILRQYTQ